MTSVRSTILSAATSYEIAASVTQLHTLVPQNDVDGVVTKQEMMDVYTNRMAKKGSPGRTIYDRIMATPPYGRCPLCGQRIVSTLDHHLPKASFPVLAVLPINLVPSCADCNKAKLEKLPDSAEHQTLHPYFDNVETDTWLHAEVIERFPVALRFFVASPIHWDTIKAKRVQYHFHVFKLASLYASHAATELINIRDRIGQLFKDAGSDAVMSHLQEEAASRVAANHNSWQAAMYKSLAANRWYCSEGFIVEVQKGFPVKA